MRDRLARLGIIETQDHADRRADHDGHAEG
jgi:hypothetical protein